MRDHNERLVLSLILRHGAIASAEIARRTGLSPQTVSVILRKLESDGLLRKGEPQRGKVGKPLTPVALRPEGVLAFGMKIGRRSCDLVLMDIAGGVLARRTMTYPYPTPMAVLDFLREGMVAIKATLAPEAVERICGVGIAAPFELWNWLETVRATPKEMDAWRGFDFAAEIAAFSDYRVYVSNDATAACAAEQMFGRGRELADYAYLFVGYFVGGGVVLGDAVYSGRSGNAGAFGTLPVGAMGAQQLIHAASLFLLERALAEAGLEPQRIWRGAEGWDGIEDFVAAWIAQAAKPLAVAAVAACSVIDFQAVLLDGGFPEPVRARLVAAVRAEVALLDTQGIAQPEILEGSVGPDARVIGAASLPIAAQYLLQRTGFAP